MGEGRPRPLAGPARASGSGAAGGAPGEWRAGQWPLRERFPPRSDKGGATMALSAADGGSGTKVGSGGVTAKGSRGPPRQGGRELRLFSRLKTS